MYYIERNFLNYDSSILYKIVIDIDNKLLLLVAAFLLITVSIPFLYMKADFNYAHTTVIITITKPFKWKSFPLYPFDYRCIELVGLWKKLKN